MKKIIFILFFLISSIGFSQSLYPSIKGDFTYIDILIEPYVQEFVEEAEKRGITDSKEKIKELDGIFLKSMSDYLGVYHVLDNMIYINPYILIDSTITRTIVFHELFHALYDLDHCHLEGNDIMCESRNSHFTFAIFYPKKNWEKALDKEFDRVIEQNKKSDR